MRKIDVLLDNKDLKVLIKKRIKENNVSLKEICYSSLIDYATFKNWLYSIDYNKKVTHWDILRVSGILMIQIRTEIVLHDESKIDRIKYEGKFIKGRKTQVAEELRGHATGYKKG